MEDFAELEAKAKKLRLRVLESVVVARKGHLGGTYSCMELLIALYYGKLLNVRPADPCWDDRDRFLIGKGHACLALYHIWADLGFFPSSELARYGQNGGLGGQLDLSIPGAEHNTGSLGHAMGIGAGIALAARLDGRQHKTVVLLGDAECDEGAIWESAMFAARHQLASLITIIDRNRMSVTDFVPDNDTSGSLETKFAACNWNVKCIDGHSFPAIFEAFATCGVNGQPTVIIADTIKGKGVSFMENGIKWHHALPGPEEVALARKELAP